MQARSLYSKLWQLLFCCNMSGPIDLAWYATACSKDLEMSCEWKDHLLRCCQNKAECYQSNHIWDDSSWWGGASLSRESGLMAVVPYRPPESPSHLAPIIAHYPQHVPAHLYRTAWIFSNNYYTAKAIILVSLMIMISNQAQIITSFIWLFINKKSISWVYYNLWPYWSDAAMTHKRWSLAFGQTIIVIIG